MAQVNTGGDTGSQTPEQEKAQNQVFSPTTHSTSTINPTRNVAEDKATRQRPAQQETVPLGGKREDESKFRNERYSRRRKPTLVVVDLLLLGQC